MKKIFLAICSALIASFLLAKVSSADDSEAPEFLLFGMPLTQRAEDLTSREVRRYEAALSRLRHVDDCVADSGDEPQNDFPPMRWNRLNTLEKVNVCIFLLAAELKNQKQMADWFNSNGFEAISIELSSSVMSSYNYDGDGVQLSASAPINGPIRVSFLDRFLAHNVSVGVTFSSIGDPLDVRTTITRH